jgi:predicted metalloprotease with PDZ domain
MRVIPALIDGHWRPGGGRARYFAVGIAFLSAAPNALAQVEDRPLSVEYSVEVKDTTRRLFHVTASFGNLRQPYLDVALPVWTPGVYQAQNYALNVTRFAAHDRSGARLRAPKVQPSTWRIETSRKDAVTVEFDYAATDLSSTGAGITGQLAFFTGTQLFLEPVGHRTAASTVRFVVPRGWRIVSALRETADSSVFAAADYDELVDAPTVLGSFDVTRFEAEGRPHFVVTAPAGAECTGDLPELIETLPRIVAVHRSIFGSLPYEKYVFFCVANLGGASLEHGNSYVTGWLSWVNAAHEMFHLWNVKRIRPAEMWPYDYSRVNPGPSLWVSEGITSYYEAIAAYRSGLDESGDAPAEGAGAEVFDPVKDSERALLDHLAYRISQVESHPERHHVSPSDASLSDGLGYGAVGPSYYHTGELLGLLLDLSILHDTQGRRGLDDVMRSLFNDYYERGKGFTADDMIEVVSANAGRSYTEFFARYVTGTEVPPYDSILGFAGYRVSRSQRTLGFLGVTARSTPEGRQVYMIPRPASPAGLAGIRVGDEILAIDDVPIHQVPLTNLYGRNWIGGRIPGRAGERVVLTVRRGDAQRKVPVTLSSMEEIVFTIERDPAATPRQLAIRRGWLKR